MQLISTLNSNSPAKPSPKKGHPYSSAALRRDLERVRNAWLDCQATRDRNAIYGYLNAVCGLVAWWNAEGHETNLAEYRPWKTWAQFDKEIGKYVGQQETDRLKQYVFIPSS
jgi:hypothetical protein